MKELPTENDALHTGHSGESAGIPEVVSPLPEIQMPDQLREELRSSIMKLIQTPPAVDILLVPARSGTLAASGLLERTSSFAKSAKQSYILIPVSGMGREVYNDYCRWIDTATTTSHEEGDSEDEDPLTEVGEWGSDEARMSFRNFVYGQNVSPQIVHAIVNLREALVDMKTQSGTIRIALLDDIYDQGIVSLAVTPALLEAALAGIAYEYDPNNNRFLFHSKDWIKQIVRATFANNIPNLGERTIDFLATIAKGSLDERLGTVDPVEYTMESLNELAIFYAEREMRDSRLRIIPPVATLGEPIQKYGKNLLGLHQALVESIRSLTEEILSEYGNIDGGAH